MACRNAYKMRMMNKQTGENQTFSVKPVQVSTVGRLLFGVDSKAQANDVLQNNLDLFEWVKRNKIYPNFWARNIVGEHCLTKDEIEFLHGKGCKIAATYKSTDVKQTEEQGKTLAKKIDLRALELDIPQEIAIFLEIDENETISTAFMHGFASTLLTNGYTPGFKVNTDAKFAFDREFSRGMQTNKDVFQNCLVWALTPTLEEYERMTTTHLIHPDNWVPFAPSGITRREIAVWQYGKNCHPIEDHTGNQTSFNLDLVRNEQVIIEKMF